jgi:hypothetical protein
MNAAMMIEKKVGEIAAEHAEMLAADISVKEQVRNYLLSLHEEYGLNTYTADSVALITGIADDTHAAVKAALCRTTGSATAGKLLATNPGHFLDLVKGYTERELIPQMRKMAQMKDERMVDSIGRMDTGQRDLMMEAINEQHQADRQHEAKVLRELESDLQEIASRPDRKN